MYKLTKLEQETIILFNEEEDTATVDTCNKSLIKQMDDLSEKYSTVTVVRTDNYGKSYNFPKKWVKIKPPRQLSEKQRSELRERAKANFGK